ncbi:hypothetical protein RFI_17411 [Reticulomyxa filosa]|uniref:Uncharacterized protein n=1 Tax=Reticulomyxa filosa TaxID=46433 RepID=X6N182_RETFI|nr:hypothetical protein RFI_17411 [Reticulomyxa filosa]|eukprot:ETO19816.1 hypothetical protein RFI_17411 [Reticulomyxa filosa]
MKLTTLAEHAQRKTCALFAVWFFLGCFFFVLGWVLSDSMLQTKLLISETVHPQSPGGFPLDKEGDHRHGQEQTQEYMYKESGRSDKDKQARKKEQKKESQGYASKDWLKLEPERKQQMGQVSENCPSWEDICVYNGHFYVHNESEAFELRMHYWGMLGQLVELGSIVEKTNNIYQEFFKAQSWSRTYTSDEYKEAKCTYHPIVNHMILEAKYMTMLGEFFIRVMRFLHYHFEFNSTSIFFDKDIQLWIVMQDQSPLYTFHHLFLEKFTHWHVQHITDMLNPIGCRCFRRLFFCGFGRDMSHFVENSTRHPLRPKDLPTFGPLGLYPAIIASLNRYVDSVDIHLQRDTLLFKQSRLTHILTSMNPLSFSSSSSSSSLVPLAQISKWKFIGFYQRIVRRRWVNLDDILRECNAKYNPYFIACDSILLEGFLHSRDVVIKHRIFDLVFGIHGMYTYTYTYIYIYKYMYVYVCTMFAIGAHLQDAIWMKQNGSFIVELMPAMAEPWASSLNEPTLVGYTFWNTQFNYFGLKLPNDSVVWLKDIPHEDQEWSNRNFQVQWDMLVNIINFLIIDGGGYCNTFKTGKNVVVPAHIRNYGFAVFNAFCPGDTKSYHYTKPKGDYL